MKKIDEILRKIRMGLGYLPGYGNHDGIGILVGLMILGAIAGCSSIDSTDFLDWYRIPLRILGGALVVLASFGPLVLFGAYDRASEYERNLKKVKCQ